MKRKIFATLALILTAAVSQAQEQRALLYPDYLAGTVYLKGRREVKAPLNYDAANHCAMYEQDGKEMILTNPLTVDSMKIGNDLFVQIEGKLLEVVNYPQGKLLIDWDIRSINVGYKGAYGTVTQTRPQGANMALMEGFEDVVSKPQSRQEVFRTKNSNKYILLKDGKTLRFNNKKSLMKRLGDKSGQAEAVMERLHTDFTKTEDVTTLMAELLPLL